MPIFKKLIFALPFFLSFTLFCIQISPFLQNPNNILSLDLEILKQIIFLIFSLLLTNFFFATFATLANDWKYVAPVSFLVSLTSMAFLPGKISIILVAGSFLAFTIAFFFLSRKLSTYLTFQTSSTVVPTIKQTATLLIFVLTVAFYIQSSAEIQAKGFQLPSSLIDTALKFIPAQNLEAPGVELSQIKPMIESQFQAMIKPVQNFIPAILAVLFYFSLSAISSLFSMLLPFFTWFLFWILEKAEFVRFEVEQREVKKLII